ncbi:FxsB family cyclophane-forming radical SAM/SPASM peptide maturase [Nonomuraea sp. NPDC050663]|uniref:FxsB family cyclophane-forming radical SAM/SPASM peptide maturase n=1 Tax=Nonomuraea sp. NPDC050663 TaxID=3364370 RepID=UPI0037B1A283
MARPFRQFILKVHTRCDLACDHCYVYEAADTSWSSKPKVITPEALDQTVLRIAEHVKRHGLDRVHVILHGGEPLLAGPRRLDEIARALRQGLECELELKIHTNGVLLSKAYLDVFERHHVLVGVSVDGDREANDRHRRYADGRSSYDRVVRALGLLRGTGLYSGLLCTIDVRNDPIAVYEALRGFEPPAVDFLLPHATWDTPPMRPVPDAYAAWLKAIFDAWRADGGRLPIRTFSSIVRTTRGGISLTESLGLDAKDLVVIETDGGYEQADSLKVAYHGAPATQLDVFRHDLDEVAAHAGIAGRQLGLASLSDTCRACPVVGTCGGGLYAHRFKSGSGFANPSVYCPDLLDLITYVRSATVPTHALPGPTFEALSRGYGDAADVEVLAGIQRSIGRALLKAAGGHHPEAWELLTHLDATHPEAVRRVIDHPYVRVWATSCLADSSHAGYLGNIAAAAAAHAGLQAGIAVAARDGWAYLPTLGAVPARDGVRLAVPEPGEVEEPLRRLSDTVVLEDLDPYRGCHGHDPEPRLDEETSARWREAFAAAAALIETDFPRYRGALTSGLRVVMPLAAPENGGEISSAARHAFGAVAAALPADPALLALLLIHEFQHVKLGALLDAADLFDAGERRLFYAPWRPDPRPFEGLLQGTYAHLAVTEFWRGHRHRAPEPGEVEFARWRAQTSRALGTLAESGALTPAGELFVAGMAEALEPALAEPVAPGAEERATKMAHAHYENWVSRI